MILIQNTKYIEHIVFINSFKSLLLVYSRTSCLVLNIVNINNIDNETLNRHIDLIQYKMYNTLVHTNIFSSGTSCYDSFFFFFHLYNKLNNKFKAIETYHAVKSLVLVCCARIYNILCTNKRENKNEPLVFSQVCTYMYTRVRMKPITYVNWNNRHNIGWCFVSRQSGMCWRVSWTFNLENISLLIISNFNELLYLVAGF